MSELDDLKAATREMHEAMKDARALLKSMTTVKDELLSAAEEVFDTRMEADVKKALDDYKETMERNIQSSTQAVYDRFDGLSRIMLGKQTDQDLEQIILRNAPARADWRVVDFTSIPDGGHLVIEKRKS